MAAKSPQSPLQFLRTHLGLTSTLPPDSPRFRPPIIISIPKPSSNAKTSLPLTLTILDLLDISYFSPKNVLTTHTFTKKLPHGSVVNTASATPCNRDKEFSFVTEKCFALSDLLPENRDLFFISTGIRTDLKPPLSLAHSLGLTVNSKVVGIVDLHELAWEVAGLSSSYSSSIAKLLHRLHSPEIGVSLTESVMRSALLLVLESCGNEMRDESGEAWVRCLEEIGGVMRMEKGSLETVRDGVRDGVKKVGKVICKGVQRSKEEIERIRAERAWKKEVGGPVEFTEELRLCDGMWELVD